MEELNKLLNILVPSHEAKLRELDDRERELNNEIQRFEKIQESLRKKKKRRVGNSKPTR